jgi:hypothetical protein
MDSLLIKSPSWARAGAGRPHQTDGSSPRHPRGASLALSHVRQETTSCLLWASQSQTSHSKTHSLA